MKQTLLSICVLGRLAATSLRAQTPIVPQLTAALLNCSVSFV